MVIIRKRGRWEHFWAASMIVVGRWKQPAVSNYPSSTIVLQVNAAANSTVLTIHPWREEKSARTAATAFRIPGSSSGAVFDFEAGRSGLAFSVVGAS